MASRAAGSTRLATQMQRKDADAQVMTTRQIFRELRRRRVVRFDLPSSDSSGSSSASSDAFSETSTRSFTPQTTPEVEDDDEPSVGVAGLKDLDEFEVRTATERLITK